MTALVVVLAYAAWWHFVLFRRRFETPYGHRPQMPVVEHFNAPVAQLAAKIKGTPVGHIAAITLPGLFRCRAHVFYSGAYAPGELRRHEIAGHVPELERLGPLNYLPTYFWHALVLRYSWATHEMEVEAIARSADIPPEWYPTIGTRTGAAA